MGKQSLDNLLSDVSNIAKEAIIHGYKIRDVQLERMTESQPPTEEQMKIATTKAEIASSDLIEIRLQELQSKYGDIKSITDEDGKQMDLYTWAKGLILKIMKEVIYEQDLADGVVQKSWFKKLVGLFS